MYCQAKAEWTKLEAVADEKVGRAGSEQQRLEAELLTLTTRLGSLHQELGATTAHAHQLESQLEACTTAAREEKARLGAELDMLHSQLQAMERERDQHAFELTDLRGRVLSEQKRYSELQDKFGKDSAALHEVKAQCCSLQAIVGQLETQLALVQSEKRTVEATLEDERRGVAALSTELAQMKAEAAQVRQTLTEDLQLREQQLEAYLTQLKSLQAEQQQPGSQADAAVLDEGKVAAYEKKIAVSTIVIYFYTKLKEQCQEIFRLGFYLFSICSF
jgi:chromosome segregation ATPase